LHLNTALAKGQYGFAHRVGRDQELLLDRLAFELPEFLLSAQDLIPFNLGHFGLVGALH
jgi:hypothetical protein